MYAILRFAKMKSMGEVAASLQHNYRTRKTRNADPTRTSLNRNIEPYTAEDPLALKMQKRGDHTPRKNAVYGIEILMTASPQWWRERSEQDHQRFIQISRQFVEDIFGTDNIVSLMLHQDESNPHLHCVVIPMKDGKLNAKHFIGGSKHRLIELQDDFAHRHEPLGLQRGTRGSQAEYVKVQDFYTDLPEAENIAREIIGKEPSEYEARDGNRHRETRDKLYPVLESESYPNESHQRQHENRRDGLQDDQGSIHTFFPLERPRVLHLTARCGVIYPVHRCHGRQPFEGADFTQC